MALRLQVVRPHFFNTEELMIVIKMPGEIDRGKSSVVSTDYF